MVRGYLLSALAALLTAGAAAGCHGGKTGNSGDKMRIVCFGDSLTACGGPGGRYSDWLARLLPDCELINRGIGGDTLGGGRKRFAKDVLELYPDILVFELGANDYWSRKRTLNGLKTDYEYMIRTAHDAGIKIVIAGCFGADHDPARQIDPARAGLAWEDYAAGIAAMEFEFAERYGCVYIPVMQADIKPNGTAPYWSEDRHPNKKGNELVAKRIKKAIDQLRNRL
ncbi:MAG: SGNH/GDSL hydrolase family protein [Victivallaceae bacterium]|nr:SGNH/GDSL hydrolase family protein [Victivallaceae bacterium]